MKKTAEEVQVLASSFYRTGRRDDGLWHLLRGEPTVMFANGIVLNAGVSWTTPADLRTVAANLLPADAKGVIFWILASSGTVGADLFVAPGGVVAGAVFGKRVARIQVAAVSSLTATNACLFGLTAGVPDGLLTFTARVGQVTFYCAVTGYIA